MLLIDRAPSTPGPAIRPPGERPGVPASAFARLLVEVVTGRRPASTLLPYASSAAVRSAVAAAAAWDHTMPLRIGGLRIQPGPAGSAEVALRMVTDGAGGRSHAWALRLEQQHRRWRCTAFEHGLDRV